MSKSKYNVQNPDEVVAKYGADCFRMYEMFLGPIEQSKPWDTKGIDGVNRFLRKYWSLYFSDNGWNVSDAEPTKEELKILHTAIKKIKEDIERFSFNTCVSAFMMCVNELKRIECNKKQILEPLNVLLAPFAPFVTEELWSLLSHHTSVHTSTYPDYNGEFLIKATVDYPVCVNGKKRDIVQVDAQLSQKEIEEIALSLDTVKKYVEGKQLIKVIVVIGRMINLVVKE
ncbi:MAG: class I tRNA ligase family protein [Saprospiraceae bacterium]|nr:class I tRNA ligase family protein [Saprospiraceae bacterium]